ncbi:MAG: enoyl-CoA hydratase/isomerase family protein [Candidatus Rokuibacteriota bacterium]
MDGRLETITLEIADGVATLTLNQPEKRNPMTVRMGEEIVEAIRGLADREDARVLVVAGAGEAFCAGGDMAFIEENARRPVQESRQIMLDYYDRYLSLLRLPIPTIAAIHGYAIGGGLALALACDLRYAAEDARLGVNFARLGIHPGMASTFTLPRAVGRARALELFYTARLVTGREAEAMGLVNRAVPRPELMGTVLDIACAISRNAPLVVRMLKRAVYRGFEGGLASALEYEAFCQAITYTTADLKEGVAAIRERREPRFQGR